MAFIDIAALARALPDESRSSKYYAWYACVRELVRGYPSALHNMALVESVTEPSPLTIAWIHYNALDAGVPKEQLDAVTVLHLS